MPLPSPVSPVVNSRPPNSRSNNAPAGHPEVACGIGTWDKLLYGNHRFVVEAAAPAVGSAATFEPALTSQPALTAQPYRIVLPWRRQDPDPAAVDIIIVSGKTGARVRNVVVEECTREAGILLFEAIDGPGIYFVYYLPYAMLGKPHYPQAGYLPRRPTAEPGWAAAVGPSAWRGAAQPGRPSAKFLR